MDFLEQIDKLSGQALAGKISEEDLEFLHRAIAEDPSAYAIWKKKQDFYAGKDLEGFRQAYDPEEVLSKLLEDQRKVRKLRMARMATITSVAAAVLLAFGALYFTKIFNKDTTTILAAGPKHRIELQMPDGEKVDLTTATGQLSAGGMTLTNSNKTLRYSTTGAEQSHINLAILRVPAGKDYKVELADGTEVWLNSATVLKFPFTFASNKREIFIDGEAYVKVAGDASRPFLVQLPNSTVQVLGTEFNVNSYTAGEEKVALVKGAVKFLNTTSSKVLKPGQEGIGGAGGIQTRAFYADDVLSWRKGIYTFANKPLKEIFEVMPRWFGIEVVIDNPSVGDKRFTGEIDRNKPIEYSLELLRIFNEVDYYFTKDSTLHIK